MRRIVFGAMVHQNTVKAELGISQAKAQISKSSDPRKWRSCVANRTYIQKKVFNRAGTQGVAARKCTSFRICPRKNGAMQRERKCCDSERN